jgi:hypothetical protein
MLGGLGGGGTKHLGAECGSGLAGRIGFTSSPVSTYLK